MDIRHLMTFRAVVQQGTLLGAARALGYSQPTVTLHIQELEHEFGQRLLDRDGKRVGLTEAGQILETRAGHILDSLEGLRDEMSELLQGTAGAVRIAAIEPTASVRIAPLLARFCLERPAVRLTLEVGGTAAIVRGVVDGTLDAGVCSPPDSSLGLSFEPWFTEEMSLLVPRRHPLAKARRIRAQDLARCRLLLTEQGCAYRSATQQALMAMGVQADCGVEIGSSSALTHAVRHGLGVAIVPRIGTAPAPPGTVMRRVDDLDISLQVGLVRRFTTVAPNRVLSALLTTLRECLSAEHQGRPSRSGRSAGRGQRPDRSRHQKSGS